MMLSDKEATSLAQVLEFEALPRGSEWSGKTEAWKGGDAAEVLGDGGISTLFSGEPFL